ncbi:MULTISPECIES: hypothetical protein [unclassified Bradyrhizobium]|uniref:hypothetical protein n=1 Tax=unclassified Bradyrhizobium TaxID=2631580 RepID=UPI0028E4976A|nr:MULTISPECIES: hypothetical protein [unclassified Bradyrhizobium]
MTERSWQIFRICCHHPPPGLASGEPDDRLQRMIQYSRDSNYLSMSLGVLDAPHARGMTNEYEAAFSRHGMPES